MSEGDVYLMEGFRRVVVDDASPARPRCPGCGEPATQLSPLGYCPVCHERQDEANHTEADATPAMVRVAASSIAGPRGVRHLITVLLDRYGVDEAEIVRRAKSNGLSLRQTIDALLAPEDLATIEYLAESENPSERRVGKGRGRSDAGDLAIECDDEPNAA